MKEGTGILVSQVLLWRRKPVPDWPAGLVKEGTGILVDQFLLCRRKPVPDWLAIVEQRTSSMTDYYHCEKGNQYRGWSAGIVKDGTCVSENQYPRWLAGSVEE